MQASNTAESRGLNIPSLVMSGHPQTICVDKESCRPPRAAVKTTRTSGGTQRIKTGVGCPLNWAQSSSGMMWQHTSAAPALGLLIHWPWNSTREFAFWTNVLSCLVEVCECWLSPKPQSFIYATMNSPEWTQSEFSKIVGSISGRAKRQISWTPSRSPFQCCILCSHTACVYRPVCMCICACLRVCTRVRVCVYLCFSDPVPVLKLIVLSQLSRTVQ